MALKGFAGRPEEDMMGQRAMQPEVTYRLGSLWSQQSMRPHAYCTAVGGAPFRGVRSTSMAVVEEGAAVKLSCTHPLSRAPLGKAVAPSPPAHVGQ